MTLNSSGPISLGGSTSGQSINLELGQSATAQISLNDTNVRTLAGVPSGAIVVPTNFYGKSSVVVDFSNEFISATRTGGAATASYRINNDGFVYYGANGTFISQYQWITPTSAANDYEVYAELTSGSGFTTGTFDAWVAVSGDPTWTLTQATIGTNIADVTYQIRKVGTATVLDTWTAQFEAERY